MCSSDLVPLPSTLSLREAMIYGTAGFTAAQSMMALERCSITPAAGQVVVTGATGGVGSLAVGLLSKLGFEVIASTGKANYADWLRSVGARQSIARGRVIDPPPSPLVFCVSFLSLSPFPRFIFHLRLIFPRPLYLRTCSHPVYLLSLLSSPLVPLSPLTHPPAFLPVHPSSPIISSHLLSAPLLHATLPAFCVPASPRISYPLLASLLLAPPLLSSPRSEEHPPELQSLVNLVCRLLLEKKHNQLFLHYHSNSFIIPA